MASDTGLQAAVTRRIRVGARLQSQISASSKDVNVLEIEHHSERAATAN